MANIRHLIEDVKNKIRSMNEIYFGTTKDIINGLRYVQFCRKINRRSS